MHFPNPDVAHRPHLLQSFTLRLSLHWGLMVILLQAGDTVDGAPGLTSAQFGSSRARAMEFDDVWSRQSLPSFCEADMTEVIGEQMPPPRPAFLSPSPFLDSSCSTSCRGYRAATCSTRCDARACLHGGATPGNQPARPHHSHLPPGAQEPRANSHARGLCRGMPKPSTLNPQPSTLNPRPSTLIPKP